MKSQLHPRIAKAIDVGGRRWWLISLILLVSVAAVAWVWSRDEITYVASARIEIRGAQAMAAEPFEIFLAYRQLLRASEEGLTRAIVERAALAERTDPGGRDGHAAAMHRVRESLGTEIDIRFGILDVRWKDADRRTAVELANLAAALLIERREEDVLVVRERVDRHLDGEIVAIQERLAEVEKELLALQSSLGVSARAGDPDSALGRDLAEAQSRRVQKEVAYQRLQDADPYALPAVRDRADVRTVREVVQRLQNEDVVLARTLTSAHPRRQELRQRLQQQRERLEQAMLAAHRRLMEDALEDLEFARLLEREVRDRFGARTGAGGQERLARDRHRELSGEDRRLRSELARLQASRRLVETRNRLGALADARVTLVAPAVGAAIRGRTDRGRSLFVAILVGLGAGMMVAAGVEAGDRRFDGPEDFARQLGVMPLGAIGALVARGGTAARALDPYRATVAGQTKHGDESLIDPYREIRTWVLADPESCPGSLLLTSAHPGEGKTTTALHLAAACALVRSSVLLVDADLRRPTLHEALGLRAGPGLADYLAKEAPWRGLVRPIGLNGLHVLTSGIPPEDPSGLLASSTRWRDLVQEAQQEYALVVVDSPPVLPVIDTLVLAEATDAVLLVVRKGSTTVSAALLARERLEERGVPVLGAVLNSPIGAARRPERISWISRLLGGWPTRRQVVRPPVGRY